MPTNHERRARVRGAMHPRHALALLLVACAAAPAPSPTAAAPTPAPIAAPAPAPAAQAEPLRITYLANEGLLLAASGASVLIDGLHRPYKPEYPVLGAADRDRVERATGEFAAVRLVLVSHRHGDHFDADAVRLHLEHNPQARLIAAPQIAGPVLAGVRDDAVRARVETLTYTPGALHTRRVGDITVTFFGLPHGTGRHREIENFGHLVELGGRRVMHVGDAELTDPAYVGFDLPARRIDVAALPYWYFLAPDDAATARRLFGAARYLGVHVPTDDPGALARLATSAPDVTPLTAPFTALRDPP